MFAMRLFKNVLVTLFIAGNFATVTGAAYADADWFEEQQPLSTEEIKSLLINRSVTGNSPGSGFSFTVYYPEYGKLLGEAGPWGLYQDEGTWTARENIYCARWQHWLDNAERCYRVYVNKDAIFWVTLDGKLQSKDTLIRENNQGND